MSLTGGTSRREKSWEGLENHGSGRVRPSQPLQVAQQPEMKKNEKTGWEESGNHGANEPTQTMCAGWKEATK